jgi:site-specific DNA-methyltransferase (adenine-specific)
MAAAKIEKRQREPLRPHKDFGAAPRGGHPCQRRLEHLEWLVGKLADGTVLDPFMGSGTTLVAAKGAGRKCIGIEIEERFCELAVNRLRQETLIAA